MSHFFIDAIKRRAIISITYDHEVRAIEPHLLGIDKKGHVALRAYQVSGPSGTGWRIFHVNEITMHQDTGRSFQQPRPLYNPNDKGMTRVIARV